MRAPKSFPQLYSNEANQSKRHFSVYIDYILSITLDLLRLERKGQRHLGLVALSDEIHLYNCVSPRCYREQSVGNDVVNTAKSTTKISVKKH